MFVVGNVFSTANPLKKVGCADRVWEKLGLARDEKICLEQMLESKFAGSREPITTDMGSEEYGG